MEQSGEIVRMWRQPMLCFPFLEEHVSLSCHCWICHMTEDTSPQPWGGYTSDPAHTHHPTGESCFLTPNWRMTASATRASSLPEVYIHHMVRGTPLIWWTGQEFRQVTHILEICLGWKLGGHFISVMNDLLALSSITISLQNAALYILLLVALSPLFCVSLLNLFIFP